MKLKRCSRCGRELPAEAFAKSKENKSGLQAYCRECFHNYGREYRATILSSPALRAMWIRRKVRNAERRAAECTKTEKYCPRCGRVLPLDSFHRSRHSIDGHVYICKECISAYKYGEPETRKKKTK